MTRSTRQHKDAIGRRIYRAYNWKPKNPPRDRKPPAPSRRPFIGPTRPGRLEKAPEIAPRRRETDSRNSGDHRDAPMKISGPKMAGRSSKKTNNAGNQEITTKNTTGNQENRGIPVLRAKNPAPVEETAKNSQPTPTAFDYTFIYGFSRGQQVEPVVHEILSMAGYQPEMYFVLDEVRRERGHLGSVKIKFIPPYTAPCCHFLGQRIRFHPTLRKYYIGTVKKIEDYKKLADKRKKRKVIVKHIWSDEKK